MLSIQIGYSQGISVSEDASNPDNSAMLDVMSGTNGSGLLIPRLDLTTNPSFNEGPAPHLLLMNTNSSWSGINRFSSGIGMYRNAGTKASPNWKRFLDSDDASYFWGTSGNAISGGDFLGTTNNQALLIKTGSNATYAQKVTIPTSQNGTLLIENLRAISVPNWNGSGYNGEAMYRIGNNPSYGLGGSTTGSDSFVSLRFGVGILKAKYTNGDNYGISISTGVSIGNDPTERLDVWGSIFTRGELVYQDRSTNPVQKTRKVERYWSGQIPNNGNSGCFYTDGPSNNGICFRVRRNAGGSYYFQIAGNGILSGDYNCDGTSVTIPDNLSIYTDVTTAIVGADAVKMFTISKRLSTSDPVYRITMTISDQYCNVIIESWHH